MPVRKTELGFGNKRNSRNANLKHQICSIVYDSVGVEFELEQ